MDSFDRHWRQREYEEIATQDARGGGPSRRRRGGAGFGLLVLVALVVAGLMFYGFWGPSPDQPTGQVGTCVEFRLDSGDDEAPPPKMVKRARAIVKERIAAAGVTEPVVRVPAADRLRFELSGIVADEDAFDRVISLLAATGVLEIIPLPIEASADGLAGAPLPAGMARIEPLYDQGAVMDAWVETDEVRRVPADEDEAALESAVHLLVDESTTVVVREHVHDHFGENLAVTLDDNVVAISKIRSTRFEGEAVVSASFTPQEADAFAAVLRSGVLPVDAIDISMWPCDDASGGERNADE